MPDSNERREGAGDALGALIRRRCEHGRERTEDRTGRQTTGFSALSWVIGMMNITVPGATSALWRDIRLRMRSAGGAVHGRSGTG